MPTFITQADVAFFSQINKEVYKLFFFPVKVLKIRKQTVNIYGEDPNKQFDPPYEIEAYIPNLPEWQKEPTKFGLESTRNLRIFFSKDLLKEKAVSPPDMGDHVIIQDDTYKIVNTNPVDYGSNIQIPLSHVCELKRVYFEGPEQGSQVVKDF